MDDRSLTLDEHDIRVLCRLQRESLGRARDEVPDHGVHRDTPALDENPGLPSRGERDAHAALAHRIPELELRRHLPDVAIGTDGENHGRTIVELAYPSPRDVEVVRRLAQV